MTLPEIRKKLKKLASRKRAEVLQGFFKTGPGEYAEGDVFLGIRVPVLRKIAKKCQNTPEKEVIELLRSPIHEERLLSLFILIQVYSKADEAAKKMIYERYLKSTRFINNWDLVDASAEHIVGDFLIGKNKTPLYALARSGNLWERRISIMATFRYIKGEKFTETLKIAKMLLKDEEDLIHKAVGWMLREVGKRDPIIEEKFLKENSRSMPRTMLRYAIERFPEARRQMYLKGKI